MIANDGRQVRPRKSINDGEQMPYKVKIFNFPLRYRLHTEIPIENIYLGFGYLGPICLTITVPVKSGSTL
jgi:hypothetical protein